MCKRAGGQERRRIFAVITGAFLLAGLAEGSPRGWCGQASPSPLPRGSQESSAAARTASPEATFPPLAVDPRIYNLGDPWLSKLADDIADGSATLVERRAYYWLYPRLYPFDRPVPSDWREKARQAIEALTPVHYKEFLAEGVFESSTTWMPLGPQQYYNGSDLNSGRATAIWVDPANASHILLGTADGGVWSTTDQGASWIPIFDGEATQSIGAIAVDPKNTSVIYVGTGEGNFNADAVGGLGMYKSTDGGSTWSLLPLPAWTYTGYYHNIHRIVVDPNDSNYVYAAVDGGLAYTTNAGTSWTLTTCGATTGPYIATDVVAAGNPTFVYVAFGYLIGTTDNGIYRAASSNLAAWTKIAPAGLFAATNLGRITLCAAPSNSNVLYALTQDTSTYQAKGIFYTNAASTTATWTAESTTDFCSSQCWYDMAGAVDPSNAAHLAVGGLDDYLSPTNGSSITKVSDWTATGTGYSHADHHFLALPNSSTIYDANDGGFFIGTISSWTTPAVTWTNANAGLNTLQFYGMAQHPTDPTLFQGGCQDNGQAYFDGSTWSQVQGGDGGQSAWDQTNGSYAYQEYVYAYITRNSAMTTNPTNFICIQNYGGCTCTYGCVPDSQTAFIAPLTLDANNQNIMYTGSKYVYVNTSVRTGTTWTTSSTDLTGGSASDFITAIHSAKNNGTAGTVYAGTSNGKFWISTDSGASWTERDTGLGGASITSIATNPTTAQDVLVTLSGYGTSHVYRSTNGGTNWTDITGAIPAEPADSVAVDPNAVTDAYVGTDYGIFENASVWTGTTWSALQYNLPAVAIDGIDFNVSAGRPRVASHGRGIWELGGSTAALVNPSTGWQQNLTNTSGALGSTVLVKFWQVGSAASVNSGSVNQSSLAVTHSTGYQIHSNWGAVGVLGALSSPTARTAVLYSDENGGSARFLAMTAGPTLGEYSFDAITNGSSNAGGCSGTGNAPCSVNIPSLSITSTTLNGDGSYDLTVTWTPLSNLLGYYDAAPSSNLITGAAIRYQIVALPGTPTNFATDSWTLASGGPNSRVGYVSWANGSDPGTLIVHVPGPIPSGQAIYLAMSVLFDGTTPGGFAETSFVGPASLQIGPTPAGVFASFDARLRRGQVIASWRSNVEAGVFAYDVQTAPRVGRQPGAFVSSVTISPLGDGHDYSATFQGPQGMGTRAFYVRVVALLQGGRQEATKPRLLVRFR